MIAALDGLYNNTSEPIFKTLALSIDRSHRGLALGQLVWLAHSDKCREAWLYGNYAHFCSFHD